LITG
jgi:hypothetical protein